MIGANLPFDPLTFGTSELGSNAFELRFSALWTVIIDYLIVSIIIAVKNNKYIVD